MSDANLAPITFSTVLLLIRLVRWNAHKIDEPGSLILVANEAGEVIIRIGIAHARNLSDLPPGVVCRSDEIFSFLN